MTLQYAPSNGNAQLDAIETEVGASPIMEIRSGAPPALLATARTGTVLATITLPADWMSAASAHSKAKLGTWQDAAADASGTPGYFTIYATGGTVAKLQGTCGTSGTDMILDAATVTAGQQFTINTFSISKATANQG